MCQTRPSKQCKSLIDSPILRQYLGKKFVCGGDEKWIRKVSFFCGEEKKQKGKSRKIQDQIHFA